MSPIDLLNESESIKLSSKINSLDTDIKNGGEISSDDTEKNSVNQDTTPTPTPNESNIKHEDKFSEFSQSKNVPQLPTTLPLKTNLNTTCNKSNVYQHSFTTQPIYNAPPMSSYPTFMYQNQSSQPPQLSSPMYHQHNHPQFMNFVNKSELSNQKVSSSNPSTVYVHVDAGNIFQVQLGDKVRDILGPATVKIVNNDSTQPVPLQLTPPAPGQIVQQIVDENGMLVHLIISSQPSQMMNLNGPRTEISNGIAQQQQQQQQVLNKTCYNNNYNNNFNNTNIQNSNNSSIKLNTFNKQTKILKNTTNSKNLLQFKSINNFNNNNNNNNYLSSSSTSSTHIMYNKQGNSVGNYHGGGYLLNNSNNQLYQNQFNTFLQPISIESNQEFKENNLSDLDCETSLVSQTKSEGDINESIGNNTNSSTSGLSSTLSISPLSSSSCSSTSASNCTSSSSSSSSNCSTSSHLYKQDDLNNNSNQTLSHTELFNKRKSNINNNNNNQNLRILQNTSNSNSNINQQLAINSNSNTSITNRSKENTKIFVNSNKKQSMNVNHSNKIQQNILNQSTNNQSQIPNQQFIYQNKPLSSAQRQSAPTQQASKKYLNGDSQAFYPKMDIQLDKTTSLLIENHRLNQEPIDLDTHIEKNIDFFETLLKRIKKPNVRNIDTQSVLVYLSPIELTKDDLLIFDSNNKPILLKEAINKFQNLNYTLEISCETENNFDKVYTGDANEITLKDLKPNSKYFLKVNAALNAKCKSPDTEIVSFQTKPLQPDQPQAPKQTGVKKKNELTLKWMQPCDNNSKISNFILEYQQINSNNFENFDDLELGDFQQVYKGPLKQFTVKKLNPSTCYAFRVAAENSHGIGEFSPVCFVFTSGSVPSVPEEPKLVESTVNSLTLSWGPKRFNDVDFELQMFDSEDKIAASHGFITIYNGPLLIYTITDLRRQCFYQFRLRAKNEEGNSAWCETKKFSTLADVPNAPSKIRTKIQSLNIYKFNWESPRDDGGDKIRTYTLEMSEYEQNIFKEIYTGDKNEFLLEKSLKPGFCYVLRVLCTNSIGNSPYSEISSFFTSSVSPGKCHVPKLVGKPKSNSVQIKWMSPDENGGAPILNYELSLKMNIEDNEEENVIYKGDELNTTINNLLPGRSYYLKLRALNKNGPGQWSESIEFTSGAACPDPPESLFITTKSSNCLLINWSEPCSNGSPIIEYRLEWCLKDTDTLFTNLYTGNTLKYELKNVFLPNTKYVFRVQALNLNGASQFSQLVEYITPANVPSIVNGIRPEEINSDSALITWKQPNTNGSPIQFYNIDFSEYPTSSSPYIVLHQNECKYLFDSLQPDTSYRFRIQAANSVGIGQFSNMVKFRTKALVPQAPNLECVSISYNSIKLKWTIGDNLVYILQTKKFEEIIDEHSEEDFVTIYKGQLGVFKLNKLLESTSYLFRICAINEAGQGKWSDVCKYTTSKSPPLINKPPFVSDISQNGCLVEWQAAKVSNSSSDFGDVQERSDYLEYCLQIQKKDNEYKEIYRGGENSFRIKDLESNAEYNLRVCAAILRDDATQQRICSPFSPVTSFATLKMVKMNSREKRSSVVVSQDKQKNWFENLLLPEFFRNLNGKENNVQRSKNFKNSSISKMNSNESDTDNDSKLLNHRPIKSDHYWAFLLIFFLVLLAFLIAYFV
ncbi:unnamed protein product, partial [Brachionus calyciflorus]